MILAKVCILGDISVGKTSLVRRYVDRAFSDAYLSTVGVTISRKLVKPADVSKGGPSEIQLVLWDLEGGATFRRASDSYLQGAHAAVIVGDLTRTETIDSINSHIDQFLRINPDGHVIVALNKTDIQPDTPRATSHPWDDRKAVLVTLYTSARSGECVDVLFEDLGRQLIREATNGSPR
jgi:small GTP-binding protein